MLLAARLARAMDASTCRGLATATTSGREGLEKALKGQVHKLYKEIHPDLFHTHPVARDANEASFKLLQQEFMSGKSGGQAGQQKDLHFTFYLRGPGMASRADGRSGDLRKVELSLASRSDEWEDDESERAASLNKVFAAVGLDEVEVPGGGLGAVPKPNRRSESLARFLPRAMNALHVQSNRASHSHRMALDGIKSALRMFRGVVVNATKDGVTLGDKVHCLQCLVRALDQNPDLDVRKLRFVLDSAFGVSSGGALHVDCLRLRTEEDWLGYLRTSGDLSIARETQDRVAKVRGLEARLTSALGINTVHTATQVCVQDPCLAMLRSLLSEADRRGPVHGSGSSDIGRHLNVWIEEGYDVQRPGGRICLPCDARGAEAYDYIAANATEAAVLAMHHEEETREVDRLKSMIRNRLKLAAFAKADDVNVHQFRQCANRLNRMSKQLVTYTDGAKLRVSTANRMPSGGDFIDIDWNFIL